MARESGNGTSAAYKKAEERHREREEAGWLFLFSYNNDFPYRTQTVMRLKEKTHNSSICNYTLKDMASVHSLFCCDSDAWQTQTMKQPFFLFADDMRFMI